MQICEIFIVEFASEHVSVTSQDFHEAMVAIHRDEA